MFDAIHSCMKLGDRAALAELLNRLTVLVEGQGVEA
jgi:hypothetical protein